MFHTYVKTSSGNTVDFDRASFLMDKDLLETAIGIGKGEAQRTWDAYCSMHGQKYDNPFAPDWDPYWDREDERPTMDQMMQRIRETTASLRQRISSMSPEELAAIEPTPTAPAP